MLGDRYRAARAHSELGRAYASRSQAVAIEHLSRAVMPSRIGAKLDQKRPKLRSLTSIDCAERNESSQRTSVAYTPLAEAVTSRESVARACRYHASETCKIRDHHEPANTITGGSIAHVARR